MVDIHALQRYSLFGGLVSDQIEKVIPLLDYASYEAGATVMREGERNDRIHFILQGKVSVSRGDRAITTLGEGDAFGEMELLDVQPTAATITAVDATSTATISNRAIHSMYHQDPRMFAIVMMNLARELSRRLRRMDEAACCSP